MSETGIAVDKDQVTSIALGAAENAARSRGEELEPAAFDLLLRRAQPKLDAALEAGELEERRQEIAKNTTKLIFHVLDNTPQGRLAGAKITAEFMAFGLKSICQYFPDLYPFCP